MANNINNNINYYYLFITI